MYPLSLMDQDKPIHLCPFSIARVRVDDETLGSAIYSGGELVGATHGRRKIFKVTFQFVEVGTVYPNDFSLASLD